jgi:hypothetical protein
MASNEKSTGFRVGSESQPDSKKILMFSRLESIPGRGLDKAERFRGVTRSLVVDALVVLDKMWEECQNLPELREDYYQLYHYLDYLKRFCDGKA